MQIWKNDYLDGSDDIVIEVENKKYKLHKIVLYCSPVLKMMIKGTFLEAKQDIIVLENIRKKEWEIILNYIYSLYIKIYVDNIGIKITENIKYEIPDSENIEDSLKLYEAVDYLDMQKFKNKVRVKIKRIFEYIDTNELPYILNDVEFIYPEFKKSIAYGIIRNIMRKMIDEDTFNKKYKKKYNNIYEYHKNVYIEIENTLNTNPEYFKVEFAKYITFGRSQHFATLCIEKGNEYPNISSDPVWNKILERECHLDTKYKNSLKVFIKKTRGYNIENIEAHHKFMNNIEIDEDFVL